MELFINFFCSCLLLPQEIGLLFVVYQQLLPDSGWFTFASSDDVAALWTWSTVIAALTWGGSLICGNIAANGDVKSNPAKSRANLKCDKWLGWKGNGLNGIPWYAERGWARLGYGKLDIPKANGDKLDANEGIGLGFGNEGFGSSFSIDFSDGEIGLWGEAEEGGPSSDISSSESMLMSPGDILPSSRDPRSSSDPPGLLDSARFELLNDTCVPGRWLFNLKMHTISFFSTGDQ